MPGIRTRGLLLFVATVLAVVIPARADVVILKDGYTLHGRLYKEKAPVYDSLTGATVASFKANGLTIVDDGVRMQVFPATYRNIGAVEDNYNKYARNDAFLRPLGPRLDPRPIPPNTKLRTMSDFNEEWTRTIRVDDTQVVGYHDIRQKITSLNPHFIRIDSLTHQWSTFYLTKEWETARLRSLLLTHPSIIGKDKVAVLDRTKRTQLFRFFLQADIPNQAERELVEMEKLFPEDKDKIAPLREDLRQEQFDRLMSEVELARESGRRTFAANGLKQFPKDGLPAKLSVKLDTIRVEYDAEQARFTLAIRLIDSLIPQATGTDSDFLDAIGAVRKELHPDTADRLQLFVDLGEQAEKDAKALRKPSQTPAELLSLAISGWMLGKNAAEAKVPVATRLWKARRFALDYLNSASAAGRARLLADYESSSGKVTFDEMERVVALMPPPQASTELPTAPTLLKTGPLPGLPEGMTYTISLPPEYTHTRSWPLLFVLGDANAARATDLLKRFDDLPGRHGVVTVVCDWTGGGFGNTYHFSEEEHQLFTGLMRHVRRSFQIDSDRVFVFGFGEGANMALDIGACYPDQFAGIIAMSPTNPDWKYFSEQWRNYMSLPVYMAFGDRCGDAAVRLRTLMEKWMPNGFPSIGVSYKGRGSEWFGAELPYIFDWMSRKTRRATPTSLGSYSFNSDGTEYRGTRSFTNRFWWMSTSNIEKGYLVENRGKNQFYSSAKFTGRIGEGNAVFLNTVGMKDVTLRFGRGMGDIERPATVTWNGKEWGKYKLTPKLSVLMEDLYDRGDRNRPFFARIDLK